MAMTVSLAGGSRTSPKPSNAMPITRRRRRFATGGAAYAGRVHWLVREPEHRVILTASRRDLCLDLASIGAVEDTPHKEVIAVVFESVLGRGGHEKKVA